MKLKVSNNESESVTQWKWKCYIMKVKVLIYCPDGGYQYVGSCQHTILIQVWCPSRTFIQPAPH